MIKEQLIQRIQSDETIRKALELDNRNNATIQRKAKESYEQHIVRLLGLLEM